MVGQGHLINVNQRPSEGGTLDDKRENNGQPHTTQARINLGAVAKRAHVGGEYFMLEKDGIPIAGIMSADELEHYLELRDPKVKKQIAASRRDAEAGRVRPASELVAELRARKGRKPVRKRA